MNWYVVSTKPRQETIAVNNLKIIGIESFSPQIQQSKIIRGRRKTVVGPLFPGYLFAQFDVNTHYRAVNFLRGVRNIVKFGEGPEKVDPKLIDLIKDRLVDGYITVPQKSFIHGQSVEIQDGPLRGIEAIFDHTIDDQHRVVLLLNALSYQARVIVDLDNVINL